MTPAPPGLGTGTPEAGADAPPGVLVPPWYRATLVLACPTCGADPGGSCIARYVSGRPVLRRYFHHARYELARELAGEPLGSRHTHTQPIPS